MDLAVRQADLIIALGPAGPSMLRLDWIGPMIVGAGTHWKLMVTLATKPGRDCDHYSIVIDRVQAINAQTVVFTGPHNTGTSHAAESGSLLRVYTDALEEVDPQGVRRAIGTTITVYLDSKLIVGPLVTDQPMRDVRLHLKAVTYTGTDASEEDVSEAVADAFDHPDLRHPGFFRQATNLRVLQATASFMEPRLPAAAEAAAVPARGAVPGPVV